MSASRNVEDAWDLKDVLGTGAFSVVKRAENKDTKEAVAVKIIQKQGDEKLQTETKRIENEVNILKLVDHPNIIKLKDMFEDKESIYLVIELVTGGELFDKIVEKDSYNEKDAIVIVKQIVDAVKYLHDKKIAHRDLKPENILLKDKEDDTKVMLSDFGLSKITSGDYMLLTACGTPYYVAPEVLHAKGYGPEVDMWSVGVITYLLLCGFPPFYGDTLPEVFEQIMKADFEFPSPYWDAISADAQDFICKLLVTEPSTRLTADTAGKHPWLAGSGKQEPSNKPINFKTDRGKKFNSSRELDKAKRSQMSMAEMKEQMSLSTKNIKS